MSIYFKSDKARVGYKIKVGDHIIMKPRFSTAQQKEVPFTVTEVTPKYAVVHFDKQPVKKRYNRTPWFFPRIYRKPFERIQRKNSKYVSRNEWFVRVNDTAVKKRLKVDSVNYEQ